MNQSKLKLWVIVVLVFTTPHVVETFAPSNLFFSDNCSILTTRTAIFKFPSGNNNEASDSNDLTIEELRKIAFRKGYDTTGMDRRGLEMIANYVGVEDDPTGGSDFLVDEDGPTGEYSSTGTRILDVMPNSYNRIPDYAVNADLDMNFDTLESYGNGRENYQPQNQSQPPKFRLQPSQQTMPPDQFQVQQALKSPSLRAFVVGFITGVVAVSPLTYLSIHAFPSEIIENESSQFLFDTVTGGISAAAFATIYRYFIQPNPNKNDDMKNGIIGAFVLCRSVSRIRVGLYCDGMFCGAPLGFMDWDMLQQYGLNFFEDLALFGAAALVLEYACDKGFVSYARDSRRNLE